MPVEKLATAKSIQKNLEANLRGTLPEKRGATARDELLSSLREPSLGLTHYLRRLHSDEHGELLPESAQNLEILAIAALIGELDDLSTALTLLANEEFRCELHGEPLDPELDDSQWPNTHKKMAAQALKQSKNHRGFPGALPDGSQSEVDLADPDARAAEIQRIIAELDALKGIDLNDPQAQQVLQILGDELERKIVASLDPAFYLSELIVDRYGLGGREVKVPKGTRDQASYLLAHQVNIARASLEAILVGNLSCEHETRYAGGVVSPGNAIYTAAKMASNGLKSIAGWKIDELKLGR